MMGVFSFESFPDIGGENSNPPQNLRSEQERRYGLPDEIKTDLSNPPVPFIEYANPQSRGTRKISQATIEQTVESAGLKDIDNLAGKPAVVARQIASGLRFPKVARRPSGNSHDAVIHMLSQERGKLPNDEF